MEGCESVRGSRESAEGVFRGVASLGIALLLGLSACDTIPENTGMPLQFESAKRPAEASDYPNWPHPPGELERELPKLLAAGEEKPVSAERTAQGISGALSIELLFFEGTAEETVIRFKWKELPAKTLDEINNSPRRQLAAYEFQKLFLDPEDYVVPTSGIICISLEKFEKATGGTGRPTVPESNCVFGLLQLWLVNVTPSADYYEEARFVSDPTYAYYLANFNLFTYLTDFGDAKEGNYMISKEPDRRQIYSVDNDIAFEAFVRNPFLGDWGRIFVAALRRDSIERLRRLRREDLDALGVVAQFERDENGIFREVAPGNNLFPNKGVRLTGDTVQLGLNTNEINKVWNRLQDLIGRVDRGEILLF